MSHKNLFASSSVPCVPILFAIAFRSDTRCAASMDKLEPLEESGPNRTSSPRRTEARLSADMVAHREGSRSVARAPGAREDWGSGAGLAWGGGWPAAMAAQAWSAPKPAVFAQGAPPDTKAGWGSC